MKILISILLLLFSSETLNAQINLLSVRSEKVHYLPGEKAHFVGTVENQNSNVVKTTLHCKLVRHLDDVLQVGSQNVVLPPNSKTEWDFYYQLDGVEYGCEVQMWLEDDSKKVSEYFGVSRNVIKIGIFGDSPYQNYVDVFAWAPDDFGDLSPKGETWWSGQGNYDYSKKELKARIDKWHERGIKAITYGKGVAGGPPGMDLLIEHPDWACYNRFGQLGGLDMAFDMWALKYWSANNHRTPADKKWYFWHCWTVNFFDTDAVKYGAQALVDGAKMFGWDGVRFDAQFDVFGGYSIDGSPTDHGRNRDELNVRNLKLTKEYIRQTYPDFLFGYNYGAAQVPPTSMDKVVCEGGGLIMDEGFCDTSAPQHPDNPWINFARRILHEVDNTRRAGGYQIIFDLNRMGVPVIADNDHGLAFCFAGRGRPYAWNYKKTRYRYDQFATRYSEYLMNNDIVKLPNPEKTFSLKSSGTIWWRDWAAVYKPEAEKIQYILHLINAPQKEGIGSTPFPNPQKDIVVEVNLPDSQELVSAYLLSPEPVVNSQRLTPVINNPDITLQVDELDIWKLLVITVRNKK